MNPVVSRHEPLHHYRWGNLCDGWNLVDKPELSVKLERIPPHSGEQLHYHAKTRQFFFILKGTASFQVEEGFVEVQAGQGLEIDPGSHHRISNDRQQDLEFILCSQPSTAGDRIDLT